MKNFAWFMLGAAIVGGTAYATVKVVKTLVGKKNEVTEEKCCDCKDGEVCDCDCHKEDTIEKTCCSCADGETCDCDCHKAE